ncbi:hypothetical protein [Edaphobacter aggregans]|uniref:hypothetical protein n=1 Tax=Edaphobacter aggregans TaxID=570835 RepID=UPI000F74AC01|nr:hypothetical protein [Edaphobacter aggregans]
MESHRIRPFPGMTQVRLREIKNEATLNHPVLEKRTEAIELYGVASIRSLKKKPVKKMDAYLTKLQQEESGIDPSSEVATLD